MNDPKKPDDKPRAEQPGDYETLEEQRHRLEEALKKLPKGPKWVRHSDAPHDEEEP